MKLFVVMSEFLVLLSSCEISYSSGRTRLLLTLVLVFQKVQHFRTKRIRFSAHQVLKRIQRFLIALTSGIFPSKSHIICHATTHFSLDIVNLQETVVVALLCMIFLDYILWIRDTYT